MTDEELGREEPVLALSLLSIRAAELNAAYGGGVLDSLTAVEAIEQLDHLRATITTLQTIDSLIVRHIYLTSEHGKVEVEGIGIVEVHRSRAKERWDHDDLATAVVDAHMTDLEGEQPDPLDIARWLMEACAPSYWRKTKVRELGIDPGIYLSSEPGKPTVSLPRREERATARPAT